jgi:hypothetical protein
MRKWMIQPRSIIVILVLQFVPLILFPPSSFSPTSQEWWLPVVLAALAVVAMMQLIVRHSHAAWPWYLVSFSQGFNIISRLLMMMPHATFNNAGQQIFNTPYVTLSVAAMLMSAFMLWYVELPEVRLGVQTSS